MSQEKQKLRRLVGRSKERPCDVGNTFMVNRWFVEYWRKKESDPTHHLSSHGGRRNSKYQDSLQLLLEVLLWIHCTDYPQSTLQEYCEAVLEYGFEVNRMYLSRIFRKWRWSFKKPTIKQIHKYRIDNIHYYGTFLTSITQIPWVRLNCCLH